MNELIVPALVVLVIIQLYIAMRLNDAITILADVDLKLDKAIGNAGNPVLSAENEAVVNSVKDKADKLTALFPDPSPPTT